MSTAETGTRSFYLDDFADEVLPCGTRLEEWAEWLSKPDDQWEHEIPVDGAEFSSSAIRWHDDVVATRREDGTWSLSREPDGDFMAVRYAEGAGWDPENIVSEAGEFDGEKWNATETQGAALRRWFAENNELCDSVEHVAVGTHEAGYRLTYRSGPPPALAAERAQ